jgi:hypothetical protein
MYLKPQAVVVAKWGEFDHAEKLLQLSNSTDAETVLTRQIKVHELYERFQSQITRKQAADLAVNNKKRTQRFGEQKIQYGRIADKLRKQLANAAVKFQVTPDLEHEDKVFPLILEDVTQLFAAQSPPLSASERPPSRGWSPRSKTLTQSPGRSQGITSRGQPPRSPRVCSHKKTGRSSSHALDTPLI